MLTALFDTSVVLDYFMGIEGARKAMSKYSHRAISVFTWVEVLSIAPPAHAETTRLFLRGFERLSINEAIADRALVLIEGNKNLSMRCALAWAVAQVNGLMFVTVNAKGIDRSDAAVWIPYT